MIPALIACFYAGIAVGWLLHAAFVPQAPAATVVDVPLPDDSTPASIEPAGTSGVVAANPSASIAELRRRGLRLPLDEANVPGMRGGFAQRRGASRYHEAVDLLAPRNTPIRAVDDGVVQKLHYNASGGLSIYQRDASGRFVFYYAHLERYASGLREGQRVSEGQIIGYVGTSGNAPPGTPHLHFAIMEQTDPRRWSGGRALDPYLVFEP